MEDHEQQQSLRREQVVVLEIRVTVAHNFGPETLAIIKGLAAGLGNQLTRIERKLEIMNQETKDVLSQIDTETTRIATAIENLVASSNDPELKDKLQAHLNQLKGIAANPEQPIPEPEPEARRRG